MQQILTSWTSNRGLHTELPYILETYQYIIQESERLYKENPTQMGYNTID